jgi:hypothetical protein
MNGGDVMAPGIPVEDDLVMVNVDSPTVVEIGDSVRHWEDTGYSFLIVVREC